MKRFLIAIVLGACGMSAAARAQEPSPQVSFLRCAPLFGRGGVAFGETAYCEVNVAPWFGVGALVGRSGATGYEDQGADTNVHDFSAGLVLVARDPKEIKRFRFGAFIQSVYTSSRIKAKYQESYIDPSGNTVQAQGIYRENDSDPVVTAGANVEYRIPHGPPILFRIGKNFGSGLSVKTAGGFYFAAGPMIDPVRLAKGVSRFIGR